MKKKMLCIIMIAVIIVSALSLFACNPRNAYSAEFVVPEGGYDGSEVTIKFYHTMGEALRTELDKHIEKFNEMYPNIHIEHTQEGGYDDVRNKIKTELTAGNQPHIAYCYPDHVALYNVSNAVVQLDNLIASQITEEHADGSAAEIIGFTQEQKDDFIKGYYEEGMQFGDGHMYTLPFSKSTEVLYYNKTFFETNQEYFAGKGIKTPNQLAKGEYLTWDQMYALCKAVKEKDPTCIPLGYDSEANWFITMCEQLGSPYTSPEQGNKFLFNNDTNKEFVKEFRKWYQEGLVTTQEIHGGYTSSLFTAQTGTKSYMSIGSSAGAKHQAPDKVNGEYPFEVGITTIPQADPENPKVISQGPSICIFSKSNPQEVIASWLFVKYLTTSIDFQIQFSEASGYVPPLKSVMQDEYYLDLLADANGYKDGIAALSAQVCMDQEKTYFTSPAFNGSSMARDQVGILMKMALSTLGANNDQIVDTAFQDALDECQYFFGE